eukprot:13495526-Alexandrium_andersonii.AAC.1
MSLNAEHFAGQRAVGHGVLPLESLHGVLELQDVLFQRIQVAPALEVDDRLQDPVLGVQLLPRPAAHPSH